MNNFFNQGIFGNEGGYAGGGGGGKNIKNWNSILKTWPSYVVGRGDIDKGNKIILPQSILYEISNFNLPQPMIFKITTFDKKQQIHCGVIEFVAEEETMVLPFWMFKQMQIREGAMLIVELNPALPKGTYLKVQPHETVFTEMPDPKGFLEVNLREFQCACKGTTIEIPTLLGDRKPYSFNIIDIKPANPFNSICLVDTNIILDFDVPVDWVEPSPTLRKTKSKALEQSQAAELLDKTEAFYGKGVRMDGKDVKAEKKDPLKGWNPREKRLPHGVRSMFKGKAVKLK